MSDKACQENNNFNSLIDPGKCMNSLYAQVWDEFSKKYNNLASIMENSGIDICLMDEIILLKNQLTKIKIISKIDDLLKI